VLDCKINWIILAGAINASMKISDYIPRSLSKVTIADLLVGIQEISFWLLLDNTYFQATLRHSLTC